MIYQPRVISKLLYAFLAWGCHLSAELIDGTDAFLKRSFIYGVASTVITVSELMDSVANALFAKM